MARCPLVKPNETVRYDLSDGDWVVLKKFLDAGEELEVSGAGLSRMGTEGDEPSYKLDWKRLKLQRILAYVKEWSFVDFANRALRITLDNLSRCSPAVINELDAVIDKHREAMEKEGNAPSAENAGETSLPSAVS